MLHSKPMVYWVQPWSPFLFNSITIILLYDLVVIKAIIGMFSYHGHVIGDRLVITLLMGMLLAPIRKWIVLASSISNIEFLLRLSSSLGSYRIQLVKECRWLTNDSIVLLLFSIVDEAVVNQYLTRVQWLYTKVIKIIHVNSFLMEKINNQGEIIYNWSYNHT